MAAVTATAGCELLNVAGGDCDDCGDCRRAQGRCAVWMAGGMRDLEVVFG